MKILSTAIIAVALMVSACGTSKSDRALSGAGIGAGVGAVGSVVTGGNPVAGALIGGAVGGVAGAVTNKNDVNLGKPAWR